MKTKRQVNTEVSVEIDDRDDMPIVIYTGSAFINLNFEELEQVYLFAKGLLNQQFNTNHDHSTHNRQ